VGRLKKLVSESVKKSMGLRPSLIKQKGFIIDQPIKAILIGASTGGTQALVKLLPNMPIDCPPIVVVQHILGHFAEPFYKRLCEVSGLKMVEPRNNLLLEPGYLYMATGDFHIGIAKLRGELVLITSNAQPFGSHRPAVNFLFRSAQQNPKNICAILLTGMGSDGASGLSTLHKLGVPTFVQNEESCEIFGMPKEAIKLGAASFVGDLDDIRAQILHGIRKKKAA